MLLNLSSLLEWAIFLNFNSLSQSSDDIRKKNIINSTNDQVWLILGRMTVPLIPKWYGSICNGKMLYFVNILHLYYIFLPTCLSQFEVRLTILFAFRLFIVFFTLIYKHVYSMSKHILH